MKKVLYLMIGLVVALGCTREENANEEVKGVAEFALSLKDAKKYRANLNRVFKDSLSDVYIRGYTIQSRELLLLLGLSEKTKVCYKHARIYLGVDDEGQFRAFLVPVAGADIAKQRPGKDIIPEGAYWRGLQGMGSPQEEGQYVFDFTMPCPNSCDEGSELYNPVPNDGAGEGK